MNRWSNVCPNTVHVIAARKMAMLNRVHHDSFVLTIWNIWLSAFASRDWIHPADRSATELAAKTLARPDKSDRARALLYIGRLLQAADPIDEDQSQDYNEPTLWTVRAGLRFGNAPPLLRGGR